MELEWRVDYSLQQSELQKYFRDFCALITVYFKAHLCDIHLENVIDIVEVDKLTPGNQLATFELNGFKCGIAICYDAMFDEYIKHYGKAGRIKSY